MLSELLLIRMFGNFPLAKGVWIIEVGLYFFARLVFSNSCTLSFDRYLTLMIFITVVIHKFVRDMYSKRFPELESLIHTPIEYIKTVQVL
jgi:hypothetical protein